MKSQNETMITAYEVGQKRIGQLITEASELAVEKERLLSRLEEIELRRKEIGIEQKIIYAGLETEGRTVHTENVITINVANRDSIRSDRMNFDQMLRVIFDRVGGPMKVSTIINALDEMGVKCGNYATAHARITRNEHIQKTGAHGYYNYVR